MSLPVRTAVQEPWRGACAWRADHGGLAKAGGPSRARGTRFDLAAGICNLVKSNVSVVMAPISQPYLARQPGCRMLVSRLLVCDSD